MAAGLLGDVSSINDGLSELQIHYGLGYWVYFEMRGSTPWCCRFAAETRQLRLAILLWQSNWQTKGYPDIAKKQTTYDPTASLVNNEEIAFFTADALETGDAGYIAYALGIVARAKGMVQIAAQTGVSRERLYRSFSEGGNLTLRGRWPS